MSSGFYAGLTPVMLHSPFCFLSFPNQCPGTGLSGFPGPVRPVGPAPYDSFVGLFPEPLGVVFITQLPEDTPSSPGSPRKLPGSSPAHSISDITH